jgi:hypothetical protein
MAGYVLNRPVITYSGDDPRLARMKDIPLETALAIIKEWHAAQKSGAA